MGSLELEIGTYTGESLNVLGQFITFTIKKKQYRTEKLRLFRQDDLNSHVL
jgi:hypothetical protein